MPTEQGIYLLSALRSAGSTSALRDTRPSFFIEEDELAAYTWLLNHVTEHRQFPSPSTFMRHTGIQTVRTTEPLTYYIERARKQALYTNIMEPYGDMRTAMEGMDPDAVIALCQRMMQINASMSRHSADFISLQAAAERVKADYDIAVQNMVLRGVPSGWGPVDDVTDGWQNDDLITFVGRPGVGKTYLLLFQAWQAWLAGYSVLFVSMELGAVQLARRLFGLQSRINPTVIRKGQVSSHIRAQIENTLSGFHTASGAPFNIIQGGFRKSTETVRDVAEATNPDILYIDASYLLKAAKQKGGKETRRENVADTIEDLKTICLDLSRPGVQSVQFNRQAERSKNKDNQSEGGTNRTPRPTAHLALAKIGETDVVAQASSIVVGATPPDANMPQNCRWCEFLKGREGEGGIFQINYGFNPVDLSLIQYLPDGFTQAQQAAQAERRGELNAHMV